jgi:hypothetical protein
VTLDRLYAFAVNPQRNLVRPTAAAGGALNSSVQLEGALRAAADSVRPGDWTTVAFRPTHDVPEDARRNPVRLRVVDLALGDEAAAAAAASWLAMRLSMAMDQRARPHLLVVFTEPTEAGARRVTMWAFPQDAAFRFSARARPRIDLVENVFSRRSGLRKAAEYEGGHLRTDFLTGRVVDFQAGIRVTAIAEYWMGSFLDSQLEMSPLVGTQLLAETFRRAFDNAVSPTDRDQLHVAALELEQSPRPTWTLSEVAQELLPTALAETFLSASPDPRMNDARYELDHAALDRALATRVFRLSTGVSVTAPLSEIGQSVLVDGDQLQIAGTIVNERFGRGGRGH